MEFIADGINVKPSIVSMEGIIKQILLVRNQKITEVLVEKNMSTFLENEYDTFGLSPIKIEFLKRDLFALQNATLDLVHYSQLIKQLKEENSILPDSEHPLFQQELRNIFDKYCL